MKLFPSKVTVGVNKRAGKKQGQMTKTGVQYPVPQANPFKGIVKKPKGVA